MLCDVKYEMHIINNYEYRNLKREDSGNAKRSSSRDTEHHYSDSNCLPPKYKLLAKLPGSSLYKLNADEERHY